MPYKMIKTYQYAITSLFIAHVVFSHPQQRAVGINVCLSQVSNIAVQLGPIHYDIYIRSG